MEGLFRSLSYLLVELYKYKAQHENGNPDTTTDRFIESTISYMNFIVDERNQKQESQEKQEKQKNQESQEKIDRINDVILSLEC